MSSMPAAKKSKSPPKTGKAATKVQFPPLKGFRLSAQALEKLSRHAKAESKRLGLPVSMTKALERLLLRVLTDDGEIQIPEGSFPTQ